MTEVFIENFTKRAYANMYDMFWDGQKSGDITAELLAGYNKIDNLKEEVGFHSKAFGDKVNLEDFKDLTSDDLGLAATNKNIRPINKEFDTRKDKLERVRYLKDALVTSNAFKE